MPLPDRESEDGRVFFNAWQSSTTRIAEKLARLVANGTILPFPEILQRRSICYVKLVKGRVLLKTKSPTCPVGLPVGGAPVPSLLATLGARVSIPVGVRDPCLSAGKSRSLRPLHGSRDFYYFHKNEISEAPAWMQGYRVIQKMNFRNPSLPIFRNLHKLEQ